MPITTRDMAKGGNLVLVQFGYNDVFPAFTSHPDDPTNVSIIFASGFKTPIPQGSPELLERKWGDFDHCVQLHFPHVFSLQKVIDAMLELKAKMAEAEAKRDADSIQAKKGPSI